MTEAERKERIAQLRAELKELQAVPRSDWHAGFEALLRIDTHKYGDRVRIEREAVLGEEPPRADYLLLAGDGDVPFDKAIFRTFRKRNIIEYKNPHDSLNERVMRKACGYANLYIGALRKELGAGDVTISIFRASRNPALFRRMEGEGRLERDNVPGIYHVKGMCDLPFQIIVTGELEGEEYAAYRALTDRADALDIGRVIEEGGREKDYEVREHYRVLLKLLVEKNPEIMEMLRRDERMEDVLMEIVKDKVDAKVKTREQEVKLMDIRNVMSKLKFSADQAMDLLSVPPGQRAMYAGLIQNG